MGRAVGGDEVLFHAYSANYTDDRSRGVSDQK